MKKVRLEAPMTSGELSNQLRSLGFDGERLHLRCWLGGGSFGVDHKSLFTASLPPGKNGWAWARQGRIQSLGGRFRDASYSLDQAVVYLPRAACIRAWRGELSLIRGNLQDANEDFNRAIELDPGYPWSYVYRAAARLKSGNVLGAQADAEKVFPLVPRLAVGFALKAILEAQSNRRDSAILWLNRALARSKKGWLYALRGTMRGSWNELNGALKDMNRALRTENSPWIRLERAGILNRLGEFRKSFEDINKASAVLPGHTQPHLRAAAIHLDQAQYREAVERLTRVIKISPRDASIYQRRARVHFVRGTLAQAQRDLASAARLSRSNHHVRQECLQLKIVRGLYREAESDLKVEKFSVGVREFWLGYLRCRQKSFAEAQRYFAYAEKGEDGLAEKARFYRWVARILSRAVDAPSPREKELFLVGLGYRIPFQVSVAAIQAISSCEEIYCNLSDSRASDFLGLFPIPFKAIVFRGLKRQAEDSSRMVMKGFKKNQRIAMVTRGQPLAYGLLAYRLVQKARRGGIFCRVPASVSIFDTLPSLVGSADRGALGLQIRDAVSVVGINSRFPLVVYTPMSKQAQALLPTLNGCYSPEHECYLLPGSGENELVPGVVALKDLPRALEQADSAVTLYLPAVSRL